MIEFIEVIRKIEAFFIPLFPKGWRDSPPSYRIIQVLFKVLKRYLGHFHWFATFFHFSLNKLYPAYHEEGLGSKFYDDEMRLIRLILLVVALSLLIAISGKTEIISLWLKVGLLMGSCMFFIFGAMNISISALWAVWGVIFPAIATLGIGKIQPAIILLSLFSLFWHIPVIKINGSWHWVNFLCTLPILFFWIGAVSKMLPPWPHWQTALLFLTLWLSVWILLIRTKRHLISKACQFFFPASFTIIALMGLVRIELHGIYRWGLWLLASFGLSTGMSKLAPILSNFQSIFKLRTFILIFGIYLSFLLFDTSSHSIKEGLEIILKQFFFSMEFVWWFIGAGIVLSLRGPIIFIFKWLQDHSNLWILPLFIWGFIIWIFITPWTPSFLEGWELEEVLLLFALSVTFLAWKRKETLLREWLFWGIFIIFLINQYYERITSSVVQYFRTPTKEIFSFLSISIWLLWLHYSTIGKILKEFRNKIERIGIVAVLGGLLWLLVVFLWLSCIDREFSIQGQINVHLSKGFTILGVPLIIYYLIFKEYLKLDPRRDIKWGWIILFGIVFVQVLQGIEHLVVAWLDYCSFDIFQKRIVQGFLTGTPISKIVPPWVMNSYWVLFWRIIRWLLTMISLLWMVKWTMGTWPVSSLTMNACFLSIAVWIAERTWIFWPFMPLEWSLILQPWNQTVFLGFETLFLYALYIVAGLLWGIFISYLQKKSWIKK